MQKKNAYVGFLCNIYTFIIFREHAEGRRIIVEVEDKVARIRNIKVQFIFNLGFGKAKLTGIVI